MSSLPLGWSATPPPDLPQGWSTAPQSPNDVHIGTVLPVTRDASGLHFDPNAGVLGMAQNAGRAAIDAFMLPSDVYSGKVAPGSAEGINRAINFGMFAVGGAPRALEPALRVTAPTAAELKAAGGAGLDAARGMGVAYSPDAIGRVATTAQQQLLQDGLGPTVAGKTNAILDQLQRPPADASASFDYTNGVAAVRANLQSIAQDWTNPKDQLAATRAIKALDEFVAQPAPADVMAGPAAELAPLVKDARANYAAGARSNELTDIINTASRRAAASGSGLNLDNSIRGRLATFLQNPANTAGFSKTELDLLEGVVKGTRSVNALRWFGNYLGGGGGLGAAVTGIGATALTSDPRLLAAAIPAAVGLSAKMTENAFTKKTLESVAAAVRTRSPLYDQKLAAASGPSATPAEIANVIPKMFAMPPGWAPQAPPNRGLVTDDQGNLRDPQGNFVY